MTTREEIKTVLATADRALTFRELAQMTGRSLSTVAFHVRSLRVEGYLPRRGKFRRGQLTGERLDMPKLARDRCALLVDQLAEARSFDQALEVYDGLVDLLDLLKEMAA